MNIDVTHGVRVAVQADPATIKDFLGWLRQEGIVPIALVNNDGEEYVGWFAPDDATLVLGRLHREKYRLKMTRSVRPEIDNLEQAVPPPPNSCVAFPACDCGHYNTVLAACDPALVDGDWCGSDPADEPRRPTYRPQEDE